MARRRRRKPPEDEEESARPLLGGWLRDVLVALVIVGIVFAGIFAYARVWPPLVVIESESMQHADAESYVGVIDTGDLVLVQATPDRADVVTWAQGRVSGHSTYGDYGDVIVFRRPRDPRPTPVIHRAILYLIPNGTGSWDVPDLDRANGFPSSEWEGKGANWAPAVSPFALREVTIHRMGFARNLVITFNLTRLASLGGSPPVAGFVTMGDHNAYFGCTPTAECESQGYDHGWVVPLGNIVGKARGEIPWFGLLKLTLAPTDACCAGWGDGRAPRNSWDLLAVSLVALVALPFLSEGLSWAWRTRLGPWVRARLRRGPAPDPDEES